MKKSLKILLFIFFFCVIYAIFGFVYYSLLETRANVSYIDVFNSYEGSLWRTVNYGESGSFGTYINCYSDGNMSLWMNGQYVKSETYKMSFEVYENVNVTIDGNTTFFYFFVDEIGDGSLLIQEVEQLYKESNVLRLIFSARMEAAIGLGIAFIVALSRRWIKLVR